MRDVYRKDDREIEMAANAASPFIYSKIFNEDFEKDAESIMAWRKMTYVMVQQANVGEAELLKGKLTESDCIMWLTQFDPLEFADILNFAAELYAKQQKTKSTPKN